MFYYNNLIQNKNEICDEERKECMKEYIDTIDSTKKEQQKIEPKTASNKDENQNNDFNKPKSITNIETIEPDFNYINQDSPQKPLLKKSDNPKIPNKPKINENIGKDISFNFENFYKLRPHFFSIGQYLEPFNIKIIESDSINLNQAIEKISIGIKKYEDIFQNEKSLSEGEKIFEKIIYLSDKKQKIEEIINNKIQNINFVNGDNFINLNFWGNQKDNINNNITNCLNYGSISSNTFKNKKGEKEKDNNFLNKKRNLKEDNTELDKQEKTNNNNINTNKNPGRLSNEKKNRGEKGVKDGSHPDNALIKIMRHSLENICSIFITIVHIIDANAYIFLPGINDKDLKNTTLKQDYLELTIEEILCSYISIETKRKKFEENKAIIKDLLGQNIPGKEKEKNLLKKILKMNLKDVCIKYISNVKDFIDGYTFNTFEDDEDFKKIDDVKIAKILKHSKDLIYDKIIKRTKSP